MSDTKWHFRWIAPGEYKIFDEYGARTYFIKLSSTGEIIAARNTYVRGQRALDKNGATAKQLRSLVQGTGKGPR
jgi:hypothetical protein